MRASATGAYDNRVTRYKEGAVKSLQQPAIARREGVESDWGLTTPERPTSDVRWQLGRKAGPDIKAVHRTTLVYRPEAGVLWQLARPLGREADGVHQAADPRRTGGSSAWQLATPRQVQTAVGNQTGVLRRYLLENSDWQPAKSVRKCFKSPFKPSRFRIGRQAHLMPWQHARRPPAGMEAWPPIVQPPVQPPVISGDPNLVFRCPAINGSPVFFVFGSPYCIGQEPQPPAGLVIVPIRSVYMVINEASLRRVDGNIALASTSMSINLDADSWTWGFSASLPGHLLANLEPATSEAPVELEALFNGTAFRVIVESITRERTFGKSTLRVQGRGKSALLDSPYAPTGDFINTTARTAQQLVGDVLTLNGISLGWSIDWALEDWLVPAGVFAHQGSYVAAVNAIAKAAGGYVQPHASLQTLRVLPRYPVAPWAWSTVTPDFELPSAVTTREGIEWVERPRYNRVFVSGQQSGVLGQVTRAGTAGDLLAPMVTDPLITTAAAARQRGLSVLANTGRQANVSLRLPVLAETGVIRPGQFVRYVDAGTERVGLVRSVSVDSSFPELWQSIGVETHV
jgi:hypothetical protein